MEDENFSINYEFDYLKDFVFAYLKKIDPKNIYYCKENSASFLFIKAQSFLLCENKDFTDSIYFCEVQIDWNSKAFFPLVKKDVFAKLDSQELRNYISENISSMMEIKRLLKLDKN